MAEPAPRFIVSVDRLDGGEPLDERRVVDVQLNQGIVTILEGRKRLFLGDAWSWLEVRRIDDEADASVALEPPRRAQPPARPTRQTRRSKSPVE